MRRCGRLVFLGLESNGPLTGDSRGPRLRHVYGSDLCSMHLARARPCPTALSESSEPSAAIRM